MELLALAAAICGSTRGARRSVCARWGEGGCAEGEGAPFSTRGGCRQGAEAQTHVEESNPHRTSPIGRSTATVGPRICGFGGYWWVAGRAAERAHLIMEPYLPRGTGSARWVSGVGYRSKANIPHCPARLRAHSSHCQWQQGTKCSVRGGDAGITRSGRRARISDARVFASNVASKRSRHSAHPTSIGKWPSNMRWRASACGGCREAALKALLTAARSAGVFSVA